MLGIREGESGPYSLRWRFIPHEAWMGHDMGLGLGMGSGK
jgi:hypothetical protein